MNGFFIKQILYDIALLDMLVNYSYNALGSSLGIECAFRINNKYRT